MRISKIDLAGKLIGDWTVLHEAPERKHNARYWLCRCHCKVEKEISQTSLISGQSRRCLDCAKITPKISTKDLIDLTNERFGKWIVLQEAPRRRNGMARYWLCQCECGVKKEVSMGSLQNRTSQGCHKCWVKFLQQQAAERQDSLSKRERFSLQ